MSEKLIHTRDFDEAVGENAQIPTPDNAEGNGVVDMIERLKVAVGEAMLVVEQQALDIGRLKERCEGYKGQVKYGAAEITRLKASNKALAEAKKEKSMVADASYDVGFADGEDKEREACAKVAKNYTGKLAPVLHEHGQKIATAILARGKK